VGNVRRLVRATATVWLIFQTLSMSALAFQNCCAPPPVTPAKACHEQPERPASTCSMTSSDGAACPMHHAPAAPSSCRMRAGCNGDMGSLIVITMNSVTAGEPFAFVADFSMETLGARPADAARTPSYALDPPPPRAARA
jgi:hypothetical protein